MSARSIASRMPKAQRDLLIAHIDGPQPLTIGHESMVRNALLARDLLRFNDRTAFRPKTTHLTDTGREVLCIILGDYADALVRAGALDEAPTIVLKRSPKIAEPAEPELPLSAEANVAAAWRAELTAR